MSFFHDCEVCTEVSVEYLVKAETAQSCDHLACDYLTCGKSESFAQCYSCGGSCLDYCVLFLVCKCGEYFFCVVLFADSRCRADCRALSAECADRISESESEGGFDQCLKAAVYKSVDIKSLTLMARSDAAAAEYALVRVADKAGVVSVFESVALFACIGNFANAKVGSDRLKFAVLVFLACEAFLRVVRKKKFDDRFACFTNCGCICMDNHVVGDGIYACGSESARAFYLYNADTACSFFCQLRMIAELRNADSGHGCCFDYSVIVRH